MKLHNFAQQTEEWYNARKLKFTASKAQAIATNGKGLETLVLEMLTDYYSSEPKAQYTNNDIDRGNLLEPISRNLYEFMTGNKVDQVGFVETSEYTGFSPDGLIGENGGFETKALNDINHFKCVLYGIKAVDKKHIWQCQMSLMLSDRKWWDLVIYNPHFEKSILIYRIEPDKEMHEKLQVGIEKGIELLNKLKNQYER